MAATLLLGVAAVNTGNNLLFLVVSAMLGFMAVSGLLGWLNIRGLALSVHFPDEVYAGIETLASIRIKNRKTLLPSFLIKVSLAGSPATFILVDRLRSEDGSVFLAFPERGRQDAPTALVSSPFPVNFFVRYTRIPVPCSVTVFPAPRPAPLPPAEGIRDAADAMSFAAPGTEGDLAKISDYRGESLRLIHWRLSAKHEELKVKHLTATSAEPVLIELDRLPGRDLEERLGHCSYLVNRLSRAGRPVGLKLGNRTVESATHRLHRLKLLGELAVYGQD